MHERKDHSVAMFDRQWPETVAALGTAPDLYLIHSVTPESIALSDAALLDRLRSLRTDGIRVGLSTSGPSQSEVVEAALALEDGPFSVVQSTWNLRESSVAGALAAAHDAGWTVVVKEVLANGELAGAAAHDDLGRAASGIDVDAFAIGAALAQPWFDIVLSGATTVDHLRRGSSARALPVDDETLARLAVDPTAYWRARSQRPWS